MQVVAKCLHFVTPFTKKKKKESKQTLKSMQYRLEIIFNTHLILQLYK